jgi:hypothetical protein
MRKLLPVLRDVPAPPGSLGRRELIRWVGAMAAARALPGCSFGAPAASPPTLASAVLTTAEQQALGAFADYLIPPDHQPGGSALGVVAYVEQILTALDGAIPMIFAGGPYSGRQPYATPDGAVGTTFPTDSFTTFLPLDRYRQAAWTLRLFGSTAFPDGGINDAVIGVTTGWRVQVPQALDAAIAAIPGPLDATTPTDQVATAWSKVSADDQSLLLELIIEGAFSSPEYGGNANLAGFGICNFEGDSQPLGYSLYDEATGSYNQRPDAPMSGPNPGPDPDPKDAATRALVKMLVTFASGRVYF